MEMDIGASVRTVVPKPVRGITMWALNICIFIIVYGRMIEIYLVTSVAPIPMATMVNRGWGQMGQNYLRSLLALGFQAFLIIVCVAIYAALVNNIAVSDDISYAIWTCMGYTVLLCFTLFKTGSLPKACSTLTKRGQLWKNTLLSTLILRGRTMLGRIKAMGVQPKTTTPQCPLKTYAPCLWQNWQLKTAPCSCG
jgi:hypothetical protein